MSKPGSEALRLRARRGSTLTASAAEGIWRPSPPGSRAADGGRSGLVGEDQDVGRVRLLLPEHEAVALIERGGGGVVRPQPQPPEARPGEFEAAADKGL